MNLSISVTCDAHLVIFRPRFWYTICLSHGEKSRVMLTLSVAGYALSGPLSDLNIILPFYVCKSSQHCLWETQIYPCLTPLISFQNRLSLDPSMSFKTFLHFYIHVYSPTLHTKEHNAPFNPLQCCFKGVHIVGIPVTKHCNSSNVKMQEDFEKQGIVQ